MVTRRTMLKAAAAAMIGVRVELRPTVPDERLLLPFCADWSARCSLTEPFGVGSFTWASDSRAMVRCELLNRLEVGTRRIPPVEQAWRDHFVPSDWRPFDPDWLRPAFNPMSDGWGRCPVCHSEPTVPVADDIANLTIERGWELEQLGLDPDEWKIRDVNCRGCAGRTYSGNWCSNVCGVSHDTFLLKRIAALPNVRVCRSRSVPDALLFRADGFEGVSLGVSSDR